MVEEGSFRNQVSSIETHFGGDPRRIALEAGAQSAWISRELKRLGHEVIVANARELKWITASDTKNDPVDARKLALLARADRATAGAGGASHGRTASGVGRDPGA